MNCKDCKFWRGDDHSYSALCDRFNQKTAFNDGCSEFKARQLTIKAGEQLDEKIRDYNNARALTSSTRNAEEVLRDLGIDIVWDDKPKTFTNGLTVEDWIK
jgi:hypothetical protein